MSQCPGWLKWALISFLMIFVAGGVCAADENSSSVSVIDLVDHDQYEVKTVTDDPIIPVSPRHEKTDSGLVANLQKKLITINLLEEGYTQGEVEEIILSKTPPQYQSGRMPSKGIIFVPVFLVNFPNTPVIKPYMTIHNLMPEFFAYDPSGTSPYYPQEGVRGYYLRSSYNQLDIGGGHGFPFYTAQHNSSYYFSHTEGEGSPDEFVREVIGYWKAKGGFAGDNYDSDNNGYWDGAYFVVNLKSGGFKSIYNQTNSPLEVDGKKIGNFAVITYDVFPGTHRFDPEVALHETGHLLGLPDYYSPRNGPHHGVGGWDMMDLNWGDHNCFSKYLLDWIEPTVVTMGHEIVDLHPSGTSKDAVLVIPAFSGTTEFFMVQYRQPETGNDPKKTVNWSSGDGFWHYSPHSWPRSLFIWHADTTLNLSDPDYPQFEYEQENLDGHKLLDLVQADGMDHINTGDWVAFPPDFDNRDLYVPGEKLTPFTNPTSNFYNNVDTGIYINPLVLHANKKPPFIRTRIALGTSEILNADFDYNPADPMNPWSYQFNDASGGRPQSWNWHFGDGTTSTEKNPLHIFPGSHIYNVTLFVKNGTDLDSVTKQVGCPGNPLPPVANFTWVPAAGKGPKSYQFTDTSEGYGITKWKWYLEYNAATRKWTTSEKQNPVFTFSDYGDHEVSLKVTSPWGTNSTTKTVNVSLPAPPKAGFVFVPTDPLDPRAVKFRDRSLGYIQKQAWKFEDHGTWIMSTEKNPAVRFGVVGDHLVMLTVSNDGGSHQLVDRINIPPLTANFTWEMGFSPRLVNFTNTTRGNPDTYTFKYGDGAAIYGSGTIMIPGRQYTDYGTYQVNLTVNMGKAYSTVEKSITLLPIEPDFTWSKVSDWDVQFTDTTPQTPTEWQWDFGDSSTSTLQNPVHHYSASSDYSVTLRVRNAFGGNTTSQIVGIHVGS